MPERPYVLLSVAASADGYIDDTTSTRLLLSNDADLDRVDEVRASADAILVGGNTIRRDNPRLLVRSAPRRAARAARGQPENPVKVTLTRSGDLDPAASFFTAGPASKIVYASSPAVARTREQLADVATVVDAGDPPSLPGVLTDLAARGVRRLMVEGGAMIHRQFLTPGWPMGSTGDRAALRRRPRRPAVQRRRRLPSGPPDGTGRGPPDRRCRAPALPGPSARRRLSLCSCG